MAHPQTASRVAPASQNLRGNMADALRRLGAHARTPGGRKDWKAKDTLRGRLHACGPLQHMLDKAIAARAPLDEVLAPVRVLELYVRQHYAGDLPDLVTAYRAEQESHCLCDPVQIDAITTRSPGALRVCLDRLLRQREATDVAILATSRELEQPSSWGRPQ